MRLTLLRPVPLATKQSYLIFFGLSVLLMLALPRPYSSLPLLALLALPLLLLLGKLPRLRIKRAAALSLLGLIASVVLLLALPRPYSTAALILMLAGSGLVLGLRTRRRVIAARTAAPARARGRLLTPRRYLILFALSVVLMLLLPRDSASKVLIGLLALSAVALVPPGWWHIPSIALGLIPVPALTLPRRLSISLEIGVIALALFVATPEMRNFGPMMRLDGSELSYLLNSGVIASDVFHATGSIPLWNPFVGRGEPLLENPFSYVLNPLMSMPLLAFGSLQGPKVGILIHIVLMGLGAWSLGYMLKMRAPGRVLLAVLMGCSGSMVGQLGYGFYQMGLSQVYVPWVFVGLLGTVERRSRWPVALLAVALMLMIFAGTFWYVLPTVISLLVLIPFLIIRRKSWRVTLDRVALRRLLIAFLLLLGLSAARLLPQAVHINYIWHPQNLLAIDADPFTRMFSLYFMTGAYPDMGVRSIFYHFLMPASFAALVVAARLLLWRDLRLRWRIVIPALLLLGLYTFWAEGGTTILRWFYAHFTLLRQWRYAPRMLAAGSPWLILLVALCYDEVLLALYRRARQALRWRRAVYVLLLLVSIGGGVQAARAAMETWDRVSGVSYISEPDQKALGYLREKHPGEMLPVLTAGFFRYFPFYDNLLRVAFGNPDYRPLGLKPTLATTGAVDFPPPYLFGVESNYRYNPANRGYRPIEGVLLRYGPVIWENPTVPAYAFRVPLAGLEGREDPLTAAETVEVRDYVHNIDSIEFHLDSYPEGQVLAVQETAYPGWRVTVNGELAGLHSLGGILAVVLPGTGPADIVFNYVPLWFYFGCLITVLAVLVTVIYLLRPGSFDRQQTSR